MTVENFVQVSLYPYGISHGKMIMMMNYDFIFLLRLQKPKLVVMLLRCPKQLRCPQRPLEEL